MDFLKVVEGVSGTETSFSIVYTLAKFVLQNKKTLKESEEIDGLRVFYEVCHNKVPYLLIFYH
jgi:hypothetical protein